MGGLDLFGSRHVQDVVTGLIDGTDFHRWTQVSGYDRSGLLGAGQRPMRENVERDGRESFAKKHRLADSLAREVLLRLARLCVTG
jgi:hypothetical protein